MVSPMLPIPPAVVKCKHCERGYWLVDAEKIGTVDLWQETHQIVDPEEININHVGEPSEYEYYSFIQTNLAKDGKQEKLLRILAWWRRNDNFRDVSCIPKESTVSTACRENLEALLKLLNPKSDQDQIMKGEILRELGQFEAAQKVLNGIIFTKHTAIVNLILSWCANEYTCVGILQPSPSIND